MISIKPHGTYSETIIIICKSIEEVSLWNTLGNLLENFIWLNFLIKFWLNQKKLKRLRVNLEENRKSSKGKIFNEEKNTEKSTLRAAAETVKEAITSGYENVTSEMSHAGQKITEKLGFSKSPHIETGNMKLKYKHPTYEFVDDPKEACCGVGLLSIILRLENSFSSFFRSVQKKSELRETYLGLCHIETMRMQDEWIHIKSRPCAPGHEVLGIE
jgi:hypothetical protein